MRLTEFAVARATEGSGIVVSLTIEREESAANALASYTFPLVIRSATAEAGEDFTLPDTAEIALSLAAHNTGSTTDTEASGTFTIAALDDDIVEGSEVEYFEVQLGPERGPDGAEPVYISESAGSRLKFAYIDDNDQATFTLADVTATEGEAAEFTLTSDKAAAHDITFAWSLGGDLDGRVSAWESANAPLGQGVLKAGEQSASFSIQTTGDEDINASASDSQKTVTVRLTGTRSGLLAANEVEAELNLVDDDKALPQIAPEAASIDEGDIDGSYAFSFSVVLDKPLPSDATTVALAVTATAAGSSVTPTPATISFAAGEGLASKSFRVVLPASLNNNLIDTAARSLVVTVKAPDNHAQVDDNLVSASVPIENEDAGIQVDTAASATAYDEGVEDADGLVVRLINGPLANPMTVTATWLPADTSSIGYLGQAGSATLAAGASGPLVIPITIPGDETISAAARTGQLSITASSSDAALKDGEDDLTGLSVTNTEGAEISWKTAAETAAEGASITPTAVIRLIEAGSGTRTAHATKVPTRAAALTVSATPAISRAPSGESHPYGVASYSLTFAADNTGEAAGAAVSYNDTRLTTQSAAFTLTLQDGASIGKGPVRAAAAQRVATHTWTNDDTATFTSAAVAGAPVVEPGGTGGQGASAGKVSFDLKLAAGETLAQDFTFNLALNITPANRAGVGNLTLIRPAGVTASHVTLTGSNASGYTLTFKSGVGPAQDAVELSLLLDARANAGGTGGSDGVGTAFSLAVTQPSGQEVVLVPGSGASAPSFVVTDADKARPVIGTIASVAETGSLSVPISLSRDTGTATTVQLKASYGGTDGTIAEVAFAAADTATTAKTATVALPSNLSDALLNGPREAVVTASFKSGTGDASETDLTATTTKSAVITDDEAAGTTSAVLTLSGSATPTEGDTRTLTLTLSPKADTETRFRLVPSGTAQAADWSLALANSQPSGSAYAGGVVTIPRDTASVALTLTAVANDDLVEIDQTLSFAVAQTAPASGPPDYATLTGLAANAITIKDADTSGLALGVVGSLPSGVGEGSNAQVSFKLTTPGSATLEQAVAFDVTGFRIHEAGGSAIASPLPTFSGAGWAAGSTGTGTLTFAAGNIDDPTRTLTLAVPNIDAIAKRHEVKFTLAKKGASADALSAVTTLSSPLNSEAVIPVGEDEKASLAFSFGASIEVDEGTTDSTRSLNMSPAAGEALTVQLKLKTATSDFVIKAGSGAGTTLTANWQDFPLSAGTTSVPLSIQAVENTNSQEPSVELEARFKSDASLLVVQSRNIVTSESITLDDNEKSFSMTAPAAMDEGVAASVSFQVSNGALADTDGSPVTFKWRPAGGTGSTDITLDSTGTLANGLGATAQAVSVIVPGDETLQASRTGKIIATIATDDSNVSSDSLTLESGTITLTNTEGAEISWKTAAETAAEGASITPTAVIRLIEAGSGTRTAHTTKVPTRAAALTVSATPAVSRAPSGESHPYGGASYNLTFAADSSGEVAGAAVSYNDTRLTTQSAAFTLTLQDGASIGKGPVRAAAAQRVATHTWTNDDTATFTSAAVAGAPVVEPGGAGGQGASAGKVSFNLNLPSGETLAQDFTFNLALNITPANRAGVGNLTLIRPSGTTASHVTLTGSNASGYVLTFKSGVGPAQGAVELSLLLDATANAGGTGGSDGAGTAFSLTVTQPSGQEAVLVPGSGASAPAFEVTDADKAQPVLGTIASVAETGSLSVPVSLSRDTDNNTTVQLKASYGGTDGAVAEVTFAAADTATTAKTATVALPSNLSDALLNGPREVVVTASFKPGVGAASETDLAATTTKNVAITDDDTGTTSATLALSGGGSRPNEGQRRTLTLTLSPKADSETKFSLTPSGTAQAADWGLALASSQPAGSAYASGVVTIPADTASVALTLTAAADDLVEGDQTLSFALAQTAPASGPPDYATLTGLAANAITIKDADTSGLALGVVGGSLPSEIGEGGSAQVSFQLTTQGSATLERAVAFDVTGFRIHEAGGAAIASPLPSFSGTGWAAGSTGTGTLTFAAGSGDDPTRTLTLLVPNIDAIAKSHEVKFTLAASADALSATLSSPLSSEAVIPVGEDEKASLAFSFSSSIEVDEGTTDSSRSLTMTPAAGEALTVELKLKAVESDLVVKAGRRSGGEDAHPPTGRNSPSPLVQPACPSPLKRRRMRPPGSPRWSWRRASSPMPPLSVVQSHDTVTSESITLDDNEKSFSMSAPAAMDEGVAANVSFQVSNGTLADTDGSEVTFKWRPAGGTGSTDIPLDSTGTLANGLGATAQTVSVTIPGDEILQVSRMGSLSRPSPPMTRMWSAPASPRRAMTSRSPTPRGRKVQWNSLESVFVVSEEGESITPKAHILLIEAGAGRSPKTVRKSRPCWSRWSFQPHLRFSLHLPERSNPTDPPTTSPSPSAAPARGRVLRLHTTTIASSPKTLNSPSPFRTAQPSARGPCGRHSLTMWASIPDE